MRAERATGSFQPWSCAFAAFARKAVSMRSGGGAWRKLMRENIGVKASPCRGRPHPSASLTPSPASGRRDARTARQFRAALSDISFEKQKPLRLKGQRKFSKVLTFGTWRTPPKARFLPPPAWRQASHLSPGSARSPPIPVDSQARRRRRHRSVVLFPPGSAAMTRPVLRAGAAKSGGEGHRASGAAECKVK